VVVVGGVALEALLRPPRLGAAEFRPLVERGEAGVYVRIAVWKAARKLKVDAGDVGPLRCRAY
jgi:hypothetical protein